MLIDLDSSVYIHRPFTLVRGNGYIGCQAVESQAQQAEQSNANAKGICSQPWTLSSMAPCELSTDRAFDYLGVQRKDDAQHEGKEDPAARQTAWTLIPTGPAAESSVTFHRPGISSAEKDGQRQTSGVDETHLLQLAKSRLLEVRAGSSPFPPNEGHGYPLCKAAEVSGVTPTLDWDSRSSGGRGGAKGGVSHRALGRPMSKSLPPHLPPLLAVQLIDSRVGACHLPIQISE
ncbi:hypothetical protein UY3_12029 [Chelonia mydas]|uniref:Uncharacterized protein n=1 Tax=Chelonia mydas TaxID=8469 RepID=M7B1D2_CHEMY|nr:hypothetical protein UY3_12029 [Chelonia mydas]